MRASPPDVHFGVPIATAEPIDLLARQWRSGDDWPEHFCAEAFRLVNGGHEVSLIALTSDEVELGVGASTRRLRGPLACSSLRTLCARLAVIFANALGRVVAPLYGGTLEATVTLLGARCTARMQTANDTRAPIRFVLTPLP